MTSVCLLATEVAPLSKTGGLADVAGALTKYLHGAGHDVRLFTPFYDTIDRSRLELYRVDFLQDQSLTVGPHHYIYSVWTARLPGSNAFLYLIECPPLFARGTIYTTDADEHLRYLAFTRAAIECCQVMGWAPDIVHCNDWHTAFAPLLLQNLYAWDHLFDDTRTVLTIHNIGYQGTFPATAIGDLALGLGEHLIHQDDLRRGVINPLKHGIMYADAVTTVSPTYAREITTSEYGMGMQEALRFRGDAVSGILNGVDYDDWDPRHDKHLPLHYDSQNLAAKFELKKQLFARLGLTAGPHTALMGSISRMVQQKGFDLMFESLPYVLDSRDAAFVILGSGEPRYERFFEQLQRQFPDRVSFQHGYNESLSHWIEAASDIFLMPSLYEPCGLNQMYSLRYGTVPIVRRTGGLADSVQMFDPATGVGTGILFEPFEPSALLWAMNTALDLYAQPQHWNTLVQNGMQQDFSWQQQGAKYVALYEAL